MYECSICHTNVEVDHINPPKKGCSCEGGTIVAVMESDIYGKGGIEATSVNTNLSELSAGVLRNTLFLLTANEIFHNKKTSIFAKDIRVKDSGTGREFTFTLTGEEI